MSWYHDPGTPPAGWYPDPGGRGHRWWDGSRWTEEHAPAAPAVMVPQPPPPARHPQPVAPPASSLLPPVEFWVAFVSIVLLAAGSVAPWVTLEIGGFGDSAAREVSGLRGDAPGVLTLLAAVTAGTLVCAWLFERNVLLPAAAAPAALVATAVAVLHLADPAGDTEVPAQVAVGPGWGAWVALVAAIALTAATVGLAVRARTQSGSGGPGGS